MNGRRQPMRLEDGGLIDRGVEIMFTFNGKHYRGHGGDTLASALLANGLRTVSRSFKYRRPRGIFSASVEEPNALFAVDDGRGFVPACRATLTPLSPGLVAKSHNGFPSVDFDLGRIFDVLHPLLPAGFYNKTFKWPDWSWYEPAIRQMAGIGTCPDGDDPTSYAHEHRHCEVLIVGAGPAGLAAALELAGTGMRVLLVEQDQLPGGSLLKRKGTIGNAASESWLANAIARLDAADNVEILTAATVSGYYDHNVLTISDRSRLSGFCEQFIIVRAGHVVLATGAIEQPLVFEHNDRPGIMLCCAVLEYLERYAVRAGSEVAVATNNDDALRTAIRLHDAGIAVPVVVDVRRQIADDLAAALAERGIRHAAGSMVVDTAGNPAVRAVRFAEVDADGRGITGDVDCVSCDALAISGGLAPTVHLYSQAGGKLRYDGTLGCFLPEQCLQDVVVCGGARGIFDLDAAIADGAAAGRRAVRKDGAAADHAPLPPPASHAIHPLRRTPQPRTRRQWLDLAHDVTVADIDLAIAEGYTSVEHLKRYTTAGMAADQGKTGNLNTLLLLSERLRQPPEATGTTTYRPQFMPVSLGAIAGQYRGDLYAPVRTLSAEDWHAARGAIFDDYGGWRRPAHYGGSGRDREQAIVREALAVRNAVGLFDASPLGKIEVCGPDAAEFLHRVYVNNVHSLKPRRVRYGVMLNENGVIMDDGVFTRIADDHFLVSTTSGNAVRVGDWLEEWLQCEWRDLEVVVAPVTTQWAVLAVAGPRSRELLERLDTNVNLSAASLPHMSFATGTLDGYPLRLQRVSFSGELSFEIAVPADRATAVLESLEAAGRGLGCRPVGLEAILVLRMEKGYLHVGADTDGTTNPFDAGFGRIVEKKKGDFIGRRSLARRHDRDPGRRQFIGIEPLDESAVLRAGAHLSLVGTETASAGFVTSACRSPSLGRYIGLAMLEAGLRRRGELVEIFDDGRRHRARVVDPVFIDPQGERLHA